MKRNISIFSISAALIGAATYVFIRSVKNALDETDENVEAEQSEEAPE